MIVFRGESQDRFDKIGVKPKKAGIAHNEEILEYHITSGKYKNSYISWTSSIVTAATKYAYGLRAFSRGHYREDAFSSSKKRGIVLMMDIEEDSGTLDNNSSNPSSNNGYIKLDSYKDKITESDAIYYLAPEVLAELPAFRKVLSGKDGFAVADKEFVTYSTFSNNIIPSNQVYEVHPYLVDVLMFLKFWEESLLGEEKKNVTNMYNNIIERIKDRSLDIASINNFFQSQFSVLGKIEKNFLELFYLQRENILSSFENTIKSEKEQEVEETKSQETKSEETKSEETKSEETKSEETKSEETKIVIDKDEILSKLNYATCLRLHVFKDILPRFLESFGIESCLTSKMINDYFLPCEEDLVSHDYSGDFDKEDTYFNYISSTYISSMVGTKTKNIPQGMNISYDDDGEIYDIQGMFFQLERNVNVNGRREKANFKKVEVGNDKGAIAILCKRIPGIKYKKTESSSCYSSDDLEHNISARRDREEYINACYDDKQNPMGKYYYFFDADGFCLECERKDDRYIIRDFYRDEEGKKSRFDPMGLDCDGFCALGYNSLGLPKDIFFGIRTMSRDQITESFEKILENRYAKGLFTSNILLPIVRTFVKFPGLSSIDKGCDKHQESLRANVLFKEMFYGFKESPLLTGQMRNFMDAAVDAALNSGIDLSAIIDKEILAERELSTDDYKKKKITLKLSQKKLNEYQSSYESKMKALDTVKKRFFPQVVDDGRDE